MELTCDNKTGTPAILSDSLWAGHAFVSVQGLPGPKFCPPSVPRSGTPPPVSPPEKSFELKIVRRYFVSHAHD